MAGNCNCGSKRAGGASKNWVHTAPDGTKKTYSSEMDARMAASRSGGTVRAA